MRNLMLVVLLASTAGAAETPDPIAVYNRACGEAKAQHADAAFKTLDDAIVAGFTDVAQLESDPDLAPLRADARWKPLVERMRKAPRVCERDAVYRQLDFWLGEWNVVGANGKQAGTSKI